MAVPLERDDGAGWLEILKRILLGRAMASHKLEHTLLPKTLALPVFSSDPLSSVAYATEEMMLVLATAGAAALASMIPLSMGIAVVLVIVTISYMQTVKAYPRGGGSYIVARENLGKIPGLIAASAILTSYAVTAAVSVTAGSIAVISAAPELASFKVPIAIGFIGLISIANLRGVKEAGVLFAVPVYGFVLWIYLMLGMGVVRCLDACPRAQSSDLPLEPMGAVTVFLLLKAFTSGSAALTGVEAIADGVQAFRRPQSKNAAKTLAVMAAMSTTMFVGITAMASLLHVRVGGGHAHTQSVLSQIGQTIFGRGFAFFALQALTAAILVLAANTAYQDFPRLSAILARDRFVPVQFKNRGDRLVFSNGIVVLSVLAGLLVWAFDGNLTQLIQLYLIGVFTAFTFSQAGMVRRWIARREERWVRNAILNAVGAVTTGVVLVVVILTKFLLGAWIVIASLPVIIAGMLAVEHHYARVGRQLRTGRVTPGRIAKMEVVLLVTDFDAATAEGLGYVRSLRPESVRFAYLPVGDTPSDLQDRWRALAGDTALDLEIIPFAGTHPGRAVRDYLRAIERGPDDFVTLVIPEMVRTRSLLYLLRRTPQTRIKFRLLTEPGVVVTNVTVQVIEGETVEVDARALIPARVETLVFVSAVHDASIRAVNYALSLRAVETRAVYFALDPEEIVGVEEEWGRSGMAIPLDIVEAPFRDLTGPVLREARRVTADPDTLCVVVLPELVIDRWWQGLLLHNNTALFIKRELLFEPRVVLTSVPSHLE